ncbi:MULTISPECIES: ABC transporter permease [Paenibacillus]|jgi:NitT/TauT family transport system permease protein|uniref:ABC transporter permease n=1 Tax=Paenibacillus baimaensis TaxID=2982185 RepID=A0ABT2U8Q7_9BACL|nr:MULTISPECIES: ABC transporter permease [unclassified Paenibacillus]MCU6791009.1 ABC transporter permease [Paenibacillus sp. WQ 127069]OMF20952.1 ABC transporter permease [Paenibacillus sp. FSL H7-0331]
MKYYGRKSLLVLATLIVFIGLWQAYVSVFHIPVQILPGPLLFLSKFLNIMAMGDMSTHIGLTLYEIFVGFLIGCVLGLLFGYLLAKSVLLERMFTPYIVLVQIAPKISIAPLFLLWFGLGATSKIALVMLVVFFPIMVNTIVGIRSVESNMQDLLHILKANRWQRFWTVEIPYSLPSIMSGVKVSTTYAITGAVIGEMIGAKAGLGYLVILGSETYDINLILTAVLLLSVIGLVLYLLSNVLEKRLLRWHESQEVIM